MNAYSKRRGLVAKVVSALAISARPLNPLLLRIMAFFSQKVTYVRPKSGQNQDVWSHFGVMHCQGILRFCKMKNRGCFWGDMSLPYLLYLQQFCSPLFGLFRLAPGFVESDQVTKRLQCVRAFVTEFRMSAFNGFEQ